MKQTLAFFGLATLITASTTFAAGTTTTTKTFHKETKTTTTTEGTATPTNAVVENQTATLTISGMHCGGCKNIITKKVCGDAALSSQFESCEVTNLDTKNQIGTMVIKYKKDAPMDLDGVEKAISSAGDYKLTKKEVVSKTTTK